MSPPDTLTKTAAFTVGEKYLTEEAPRKFDISMRTLNRNDHLNQHSFDLQVLKIKTYAKSYLPAAKGGTLSSL